MVRMACACLFVLCLLLSGCGTFGSGVAPPVPPVAYSGPLPENAEDVRCDRLSADVDPDRARVVFFTLDGTKYFVRSGEPLYDELVPLSEAYRAYRESLQAEITDRDRALVAVWFLIDEGIRLLDVPGIEKIPDREMYYALSWRELEPKFKVKCKTSLLDSCPWLKLEPLDEATFQDLRFAAQNLPGIISFVMFFEALASSP